MIDALLIIRRSRRTTAEDWIDLYCSPLLVCAPIPVESFLAAQFHKPADATLFALEAADRGWEVSDAGASIKGDAIDLAEELDWSRALARQCGMERRVRLCIYTLSRYEFDTAANYRAFCKKFGAHTVLLEAK